MYIRFVLSGRDPYAGVEEGFFRHAYSVARDENTPEWLQDELRRELDWFDEYLDVPGRLWRTFKRRGTVYGVCWFRPEAKEAVQRARYATWLMEEAGTPTREIRAWHPGEIMWRDPLQIVAKPARDMPRGFH